MRKLWVCDPDSIKQRAVTYVPGLLKIFDEVLVYAADNKQRDPSMDMLRVEVDADQGRISIWYNGEGIPIDLHDEGVFMPEVIFSHLGSCLCCEDTTGVKLANIFSTEFIIETANQRQEKKYKQGQIKCMDNTWSPKDTWVCSFNYQASCPAN